MYTRLHFRRALLEMKAVACSVLKKAKNNVDLPKALSPGDYVAQGVFWKGLHILEDVFD